MTRWSKSLPPAVLLVGVLASLLAAGCGGGQKPPATIKAWQEETQTAAADVVTASPGAETSPVAGQADRKELEKRVEVLSVGYAAEGAYLMVNLKAPPRLAMMWQPSDFSITDEATGVTYHNVPLMPKIGFLIGRPAIDGQLGYVMLENKPWLKPGSTVTVRIGGVVKKHMLTQTSQNTTPTSP